MTAAEGTLRCIGSPPAPGLLDAVQRGGWTVLAGASEAPAAAGASAPLASLLLVDQRCDGEVIAADILRSLDAGGAVVLCVPEASKPPEALAQRLPVNPWTFSDARLRRYDAGVRAVHGSAFAAISGALAVSTRFDLHLPGAPIENGMMRYLWTDYAKGPLVSDWQTELVCTLDGGLPLLITARSGAGRIAILGTSIADAELAASPGYPALCSALLAWAAPHAPVANPPAAPGAGAALLTLAIPRHQSDGLAVKIRNSGTSAAGAVLSWKVCDWGREHLSASSQEVQVPAGGSLAVRLVDLAPAGVLPWRRIDAALLPLDRSSVLVRRQQAVAISPQLSLAIEDDPGTYGDMQDWALTDADAWCDGRIASRYVCRPGASAQITVIVRNGLMNLAPLATAQDLGFPGNPSAQGLNDLSDSVSGMRLPMAVQGGWSGKPAAEQNLALTWEEPVVATGYRLLGYGSNRHWNLANPLHHDVDATLASGGHALLAHLEQAVFASRRGTRVAWCEQSFTAAAISACTLHITGLDPQANLEPHHITPSNCSIQEWEVWGWPERSPPAAVSGELTITASDPATGALTVLLREQATIAGASAIQRTVTVPTGNGLHALHLAARFVAGTASCTQGHDLLVVPATGVPLADKEHLADFQTGLLCSPGWVHTVGFGLGMHSQTEGWGGPDDKLWAYGYDLLETGTRARDAANRMFTSASAATHYTNPWRETPGGWCGWDLAADGLIAEALAKHAKRVHVVGSDRWNGVPIGGMWGWDTFVAFDQSLRAAGGTGLKGRSRAQVIEEISTSYGDRWQRWQLERYADRLLATQQRFAEHGLDFTFETHGSFPLCGGELGAKLAKTHIGVGTDLFWELRNQDLWWSLGTRFGVVAANPDLRSGAYGQWGWDNSECNPWWWANNGGRDTAQRQWYATYFAGRIDLAGRFQPYHVMGWGSQGGVGTKLYADEIATWNRVSELTSQLRPEVPAGWGMVVSWAEQERRMGAQLGEQGFGLYAGKGYDQIDILMANVYHKLVKNGLPVSVVTSTHALKQWQGALPLVLVDGFAWSAWEIAAVQRLNRAGTPLLCIGDDAQVQGDEAAAFYGVRKVDGQWQGQPGTERVELPGGACCFITARAGCGLVAWCPVAGKALAGQAAQKLVRELEQRAAAPLVIAQGLTCTATVSHGRLLLALCDQGDEDRLCQVTVKPGAWLKPDGEPCAIDLDAGMRCAGSWDGDSQTLTFRVPMPASGGRMILISGATP